MLYIAGLDEAGRGPLAGPVTAGCVVLPPDFPLEILNDSKKLSEKRREAAERLIKEKACWGFARVEHDEIDRINILKASLKAMSLAYGDMIAKLPAWLSSLGLSDELDLEAVVDGLYAPDLGFPVRAVVKADGSYPAVMAASIIAKVGRDRIMKEYDARYPGYGYARHKGYPTKAHVEACRRLGPSPIQRMTFSY
ncbi:MAG: ribonuclease HII [Treponema sp.]|nr:ribonuclease HII [Treponema sp.]